MAAPNIFMLLAWWQIQGRTIYVETESLKTGLSTVDSVDHAIESFD
jgi:hypothetical protein